MASNEETLEDLLRCPVCFEDFTDTGDMVPRTLPCTHKVCTGCVKKLHEQVKRECPFCRKVLDKDIRNFPQDKFVIAYLKEKREEKREAKSTCPKHGMPLILFCRDDKVAICQQCLLESHNGHKFIDIKEIERKDLLQRVGALKSRIAKEALEKAKEELVNKADKSVANLKKEDTKNKEVNGMNSTLDTPEDIRVMCDSLSDNIGGESRQELLTKIETLSDIERNAAEHLSQDFKYFKKTIPVDFSTDDDVDVAPLDETSVLVSGLKQDHFKLARVNIQTGEELISVKQTGWVPRMAIVEHGGSKVVALSRGESMKIEFRDVETLQRISTHSVDPHQPGALCVSSLSTLLYEDFSQRPERVHTLDCSGAEPRHVGVINTELDWIRDMCVVKNGGVELLVCVGSEIMTAHDLRTGEVKWRVDRSGFEGGFKPCSVTSDGRGHVYICDNERMKIRTFHVSDGRYLGERQRALEALCEQGITYPLRLRWNSADSSLVISHIEPVDGVKKWFLSVVRVE